MPTRMQIFNYQANPQELALLERDIRSNTARLAKVDSERIGLSNPCVEVFKFGDNAPYASITSVNLLLDGRDLDRTDPEMKPIYYACFRAITSPTKKKIENPDMSRATLFQDVTTGVYPRMLDGKIYHNVEEVQVAFPPPGTGNPGISCIRASAHEYKRLTM